MSGLSAGWAEFELGTVFEARRGRSVMPAKEPEQQFELYSVPAFPTGVPERSAGSDIGSSKQAVVPDTVLLCRINPRINRVWLVAPESDLPQIASTEWVPLKPVSGIVSPFVMHALRTPAVRRYLTANVSGVGGSLMRVRMAALWRTRLPLAPLPEQHRIVAKIEELFAKLDVGIAALKRAEANLERYRASVLKAAAGGRLTEQWRKENPPEKSGEELLGGILAERRKRWEDEQLAKFEAQGKRPPKNWNEKYKEPVAPDPSGSAELPVGWCWATVDQLTTRITSGSRGWAKYYDDRGSASFIRIGNVVRGSLSPDLTNVQRVSPPKGAEGRRTMVREGDLVVSITADLGRVSLIPKGIGLAYINQHLALCRPVKGSRSHWEYAALFLQSSQGQGALLRRDRGAVKAGLGLDDIREVAVPLPPLAEQERICATHDSRSAASSAVLVELSRTIARSKALRQSILKHAFEGRLVPQDPDDEPASVLLERMRTEQEGEEKKRKRRSKKPKRKRSSQVP